MVTEKQVVEELRRDVEALAVDIFRAERAFFLWRCIGQHAEQINAANFGDLFAGLQATLSDHMVLMIARLYERPNRKFPVRSVPSVLSSLEQERGRLRFYARKPVESEMVSLGADQSWLCSLTDEQLKDEICAALRASLPDINRSSYCALSQGLESVKTLRDKSIAHPEAIDEEGLPSITWKECLDLLSLAKKIITIIGYAFLGIGYTAGGIYFLTEDAERVERAMRRLLRKAGLKPTKAGEVADMVAHNTGPQADG